MLDMLPKRAFFRFEFPIHYLARTPRIDGSLSKWSGKYLIPPLVELDGVEAFADVYTAWNEENLFVAFDVRRGRGALQCDPEKWWTGDGMRLCVDTRDARDVKRATRFCAFFYFLPIGGGGDRKHPIVGQHRMSRARESAPAADVSRIKLAVQMDRDGYSLEAALPASCLHGWDPRDHPRIGLFYKVSDTRRGDQHLTTVDELGWNVDPGLWATGALTR